MRTEMDTTPSCILLHLKAINIIYTKPVGKNNAFCSVKIFFVCFSAHFTKSWRKLKIWSVSLIPLLLFVAEDNIITSFVG